MCNSCRTKTYIVDLCGEFLRGNLLLLADTADAYLNWAS